MIPFISRSFIAAGLLLSGAGGTFAHVTLPAGGATAGSPYTAVFRVGHACEGAKSTTAIRVQFPEGFTFTSAQPRDGWGLSTTMREVSWTAQNAKNALPGKTPAEFVVNGRLPRQPGTLWFKVLQSCDKGSADWAQIPTSGTDVKDLKYPAARLDVLAPGTAAVNVQDAWVRATVPGQSGTGVFMKLSAPAGGRLVGASTPVADVAEVHEMKMEGNTMKMRALDKGLELPANQSVELKPGGYHLMLTDLKQPLVKDTEIELTLRFEDAKGQPSTRVLQVPVRAAAPGKAQEMTHMH